MNDIQTAPRIGRLRLTNQHNPWKWECQLRDLLTDDDGDENANKVGLELFRRLEILESMGGPAFEWADNFRDNEGLDHFNGSLEMLYDWADDERVLLN